MRPKIVKKIPKREYDYVARKMDELLNIIVWVIYGVDIVFGGI